MKALIEKHFLAASGNPRQVSTVLRVMEKETPDLFSEFKASGLDDVKEFLYLKYFNKEKPLCIVCETKHPAFKGYTLGYASTCSRKCRDEKPGSLKKLTQAGAMSLY